MGVIRPLRAGLLLLPGHSFNSLFLHHAGGDSTNRVPRDPLGAQRDPLGSHRDPRGFQEDYFELFSAILACFGLI